MSAVSSFGPKPGQHREDCDYTLRGNRCSCEYPRYLEAVESIAQDYISSVVGSALDEDYGGWEEYPDLPEFAWDDVRAQVRRLAGRARKDESSTAYRALSALATDSD